LQEVKRKTTSKEFVLWMTYLQQRKKRQRDEHEKQDWYMAQLAAEVHKLSLVVEAVNCADAGNRSILYRQANAIKIDSFLLKFKMPEKLSPEEEQQRRKTKLRQTKAIVAQMVGLNPKEVCDG
jgi:hypothetical protein